MNLDYHTLYVENPPRSESFYNKIFNFPARESGPTFVLYDMPMGNKLGLWARDEVQPKSDQAKGGSELTFSVSDKNTVLEIYNDWKSKGIPMIQDPTDMDFGYTFVALDPDGHRLRVFALSLNPK